MSRPSQFVQPEGLLQNAESKFPRSLLTSIFTQIFPKKEEEAERFADVFHGSSLLLFFCTKEQLKLYLGQK